jgi:hypothetical protein
LLLSQVHSPQSIARNFSKDFLKYKEENCFRLNCAGKCINSHHSGMVSLKKDVEEIV